MPVPPAIFNVGVRIGRPIAMVEGPPEGIAAAVDRAYDHFEFTLQTTPSPHDDTPSFQLEGAVDVEHDLARTLQSFDADVLSTQGKAPVVRLVDLILFEAILRSASDVHIQPVRDRTLVRYRLDGVLHAIRELPGTLASAVISRVKVMARLDVSEHRAPQDGRATVTVGHSGATSAPSRRVDLRISTLPSTHGERVVIRLLDTSQAAYLLNFSALGMPPEVEHQFLRQVSRTSGIVLSTGPTGSGKTTTLYTTLAWITQSTRSEAMPSEPPPPPHGKGRHSQGQSPETSALNILTIEDPVEYDLSGAPGGGLSISQTQVDPKKNVTFATGLRHILRQDPDVIMVGEIRDEETARIAVQASLTGHLVLSTLHTNDAPSAVARLLDLGIEPYLASSSLSAVLAQRLARTIHESCAGRGCSECFRTGYKGRTGVFELLIVDDAVRELIGRRASSSTIAAAAQQRGMRTLFEAGMHLVATGRTTKEEIARIIQVSDTPTGKPGLGEQMPESQLRTSEEGRA